MCWWHSCCTAKALTTERRRTLHVLYATHSLSPRFPSTLTFYLLYFYGIYALIYMCPWMCMWIHLYTSSSCLSLNIGPKANLNRVSLFMVGALPSTFMTFQMFSPLRWFGVTWYASFLHVLHILFLFISHLFYCSASLWVVSPSVSLTFPCLSRTH